MSSNKEYRRFIISVQMLSSIINLLTDPQQQQRLHVQAETIIKSIATINRIFYKDNENMFIFNQEEIDFMVKDFCNINPIAKFTYKRKKE